MQSRCENVAKSKFMISTPQKHGPPGNFLVVQWLGLNAFTAGVWFQSLVGELRSHKSCGVTKKKKQKRKHGPLDFLSHWMASSSIVIWIIHGTVFFLTKISNHSTIWLFYLQNLILQAFILSSLHIYYP